jgi:hypothetical protein
MRPFKGRAVVLSCVSPISSIHSIKQDRDRRKFCRDRVPETAIDVAAPEAGCSADIAIFDFLRPGSFGIKTRKSFEMTQ